MAVLVEQASGKKSGRAAQAAAPRDRLRGELFLHGREQGRVEDGLVIPPSASASSSLASIGSS
jgi:hypothetical protein